MVQWLFRYGSLCLAFVFFFGSGVLPASAREVLPVIVPDDVSPRSRLLLRAKHPGSWKVVEGGARAEILFDRGSGAFRIRGDGLAPDTAYVLARVNAVGRSGEFLGAARSDRQGNLAFCGRWWNWHGTFWLVTAADIGDMPQRPAVGDRMKLKAWNPSAYLFESEVLR